MSYNLVYYRQVTLPLLSWSWIPLCMVVSRYSIVFDNSIHNSDSICCKNWQIRHSHTRQNMIACECVMNYLQLSLDSAVNSFVAALSLNRVQTLSIYSFMRYMHPITVMVKVPYEAKERHFPPPIYASRRSTANCYNARGGTRPLTRRGANLTVRFPTILHFNHWILYSIYDNGSRQNCKCWPQNKFQTPAHGCEEHSDITIDLLVYPGNRDVDAIVTEDGELMEQACRTR